MDLQSERFVTSKRAAAPIMSECLAHREVNHWANSEYGAKLSCSCPNEVAAMWSQRSAIVLFRQTPACNPLRIWVGAPHFAEELNIHHMRLKRDFVGGQCILECRKMRTPPASISPQ